MQIISNGETTRSNTVQDLIKFNAQFLATPAKKNENNYFL